MKENKEQLRSAEEILTKHLLTVHSEYSPKHISDCLKEDTEEGQFLRACVSAMTEYAKQFKEGVGQKEALNGWISVKDQLPDNDQMFCVFAKWYAPWNSWHACEGMTWKEFKGCREYDLKNEYTHWMPLPPKP